MLEERLDAVLAAEQAHGRATAEEQARLDTEEDSRIAHLIEKSDPLFPGPRSVGPLCNRSFRRYYFDAPAIGIGQAGLTPYELRHTCASLVVAARGNVKVLQRILGHSSANETLDTYADLFEADLDDIAVALDLARARTVVGELWARPETTEAWN